MFANNNDARVLLSGLPALWLSRHSLFTNFSEGVPQLSGEGVPVTGEDASSSGAAGTDIVLGHPGFKLFGTDAVSLVAATFDAGGGIKLTADNDANDQAGIFPRSDGQGAWASGFLSDAQPSFGYVIKTGASIAATRIKVGAGLTATLNDTTDNDQVHFSYDTSTDTDAYWRVNGSINGTDFEYRTDFPIEADTTFFLGISLDAARKSVFVINDQVVYETGTALITAKTLLHVAGIQTLAAAAKDLYIRSVAGSLLLG